MPLWLVPKTNVWPFSKDSIVSLLSLSGCLPAALAAVAICWGLSARLCVPVMPSTSTLPPQSPTKSSGSAVGPLPLQPPQPHRQTNRSLLPRLPLRARSLNVIAWFASEADWEGARGVPHFSMVDRSLTLDALCCQCSAAGGMCVESCGGIVAPGFWGSSKEDYTKFLLICNQMSQKEIEEDGEGTNRRWCLSPYLKSKQIRDAVQPQPMSEESRSQHE